MIANLKSAFGEKRLPGLPPALSKNLTPMLVLALGITAAVMLFLWKDQSNYKPVFGAHEKVAASDMMAIGFMRTVHAAGLRAPRDVSVVGFDGIEFADYCEPPLTTVELAQAATDPRLPDAIGVRARCNIPAPDCPILRVPVRPAG